MKKLEELVQDSYAGCITDFEDIGRIMVRVSGLSWGNLMDMVDEETEESGMSLISSLLEEQYRAVTDEDSMKEIFFPELLSMLDKENFRWLGDMEASQYPDQAEEYEEEYEEEYPDIELNMDPCRMDVKEEKERVFCLYMFLLLLVLKQAQKTSNLLRMFSAIGIERLFQYLETLPCGEDKERRDREGFQEMKKNLCQKAQEWQIRIDARTSIGDLLKQAENLRNKNWCPWKPLEDYAEEIRGSYDLCGELLIECFRVFVPGSLKPEQIISDIKIRAKFKPFLSIIQEEK